jgi:hypothetical protein
MGLHLRLDTSGLSGTVLAMFHAVSYRPDMPETRGRDDSSPAATARRNVSTPSTSGRPGFVTLGQIGARLPVLDVACNRCDRLGRLRTARLVLEHGADLPLPELRHVVAADCPRLVAGRLHDVCGVHFPGLATLT